MKHVGQTLSCLSQVLVHHFASTPPWGPGQKHHNLKCIGFLQILPFPITGIGRQKRLSQKLPGHTRKPEFSGVSNKSFLDWSRSKPSNTWLQVQLPTLEGHQIRLSHCSGVKRKSLVRYCRQGKWRKWTYKSQLSWSKNMNINLVGGFFPPVWKNMLVKLDHFPNGSGVKIKFSFWINLNLLPPTRGLGNILSTHLSSTRYQFPRFKHL